MWIYIYCTCGSNGKNVFHFLTSHTHFHLCAKWIDAPFHLHNFFLYLKWSFDECGAKNNNPKNEQKESVFRKVTSYLLFFGSVSFILLVYSFRSVGWRYYDILHYQHCIFLSLMRWWTFEQTRTLGKSIAFKSHALLHALSFYFLFKSNFLFNTI